MQLAIALSQSEAESKENEKKRATSQIIQQATPKETERAVAAGDEKVRHFINHNFMNHHRTSTVFSFRKRRYLRS